MLNWQRGKFSADLFAIRPEFVNLYFLSGPTTSNAQVYGTQLRYSPDERTNIGAVYYDIGSKDAYVGKDMYIWELGADHSVTKKFKLWAEYIRASNPSDKYGLVSIVYPYGMPDNDGWAAGVVYDTIDKNKPGSYKLWTTYYDMPAYGTIVSTLELRPQNRGGKGWNIGANAVLAKNIDLSVEYYHAKDNESSNTTGGMGKYKENLLWTYLRFYF